MSRLIRYDDAVERLGAHLMANAQIDWGETASTDIEDWKELADMILNGVPTIDAVEVVRGEWIEHKERTIVRNDNFIDFFPTEYECSNCGLREAHFFINSKLHNYCPNCGAKMNKENNDAG